MGRQAERELEKLLTLVRQGLATPEVIAQIHALIADDPALRRAYIREMYFQASLYWLHGAGESGTGLRTAAPQDAEARRRRLSPRAWVAVALVIAAAGMTLLAAWTGFRFARPAGYVSDQYAVQLRDGQRPAPGAELRTRDEVSLVSGVIELTLARGAVITLAESSGIRIDSPNQVTLMHGELVAEVPPSASGFTVVAGSVKAVDLGTRFGVQIGADQSPEIHVFEGRVETRTDWLPSQLLQSGSASRYTPDGRARKTAAVSTDLFTRSLGFAEGIAAVNGGVQLVLDPRRHTRPDGSLANGPAHLLLEQRGLALPEDLEIVTVDTTELHTGDEPQRAVLPAGTEVDVYFLQFRPEVAGDERCEVTFRRRVIGFLLEPIALTRSDELFGLKNLTYVPRDCVEAARGSIVSNSAGRPQRGEILSLSSDRRTMKLYLQAGGRDVDQLRVLVEPAPRSTDLVRGD